MKTNFVHNENIGDLNYLSAYETFVNFENKQLAYINLPYFAKQSKLREEISNFIVAIINLYVILILIAIVIAVFISNRISEPLRLIQNKFREIDLNKSNEQIIYDRDDEIGSLIKEYNRMVVELANSADLLAKSERESAWREMAKQIAHEIKNPLTPMKLSVQFLQRSWNESDANFKRRLDKVSQTLIEQIDALSAIATEFSTFAKMPKANNEVINIVSVVNSCVQLFENTENLTLAATFDENECIEVFADKEQLKRVFINLIKNAIQAIPDEKQGHIDVTIKNGSSTVTISIEDNGAGITTEAKDKLFEPSFTTKNSGMGMGLAIVKNIVENADGKIWYETELSVGTKFFVELPVHQNA